MDTKYTISGKKVQVRIKAISALLFSLIALQACQKDNKLIDENKQLTSTFSSSSIGSLYEVSTFFQGYPALDNLFRICRDADNNLYATSAVAGKVYKITNTAMVSDLPTFPSASNIIGVKAGAKGTVYVAVYAENRVVKIDKNGLVTTIPVSIGLNKPSDVAIGPDSTLYITDQGNRRIVKVTKNGVASILAGKTGVEGAADGKGTNARFVYASNIRYAADNTLWVLDADPATHIFGRSLRKITLDGTVSTFYKVTKLGIQTSFVDFAPAKRDKNFDPTSKENFFLITNNVTLQGVFQYKISHLSSEGIETTIMPFHEAGYQDGPADQAILSGPNGIAVTTFGIFLADGNSAIRKISRKL
ncbi:hypothetical protein [Mucilaginibacter sp.]|jgi:hypothetical protein|uniref:hypothetical protein n=1 Tax=Mucilaginibacter sp. TaxID=1882438 RepID=UPI0035652615